MIANRFDRSNRAMGIFLRLAFALAIVFASPAIPSAEDSVAANSGATQRDAFLLLARRVFDGVNFRANQAVLIAGATIVDVGSAEDLKARAKRVIDLGDATILPGFVELHAHSVLKKIPQEIILKHGVTTIRDLGGPLLPASGGLGRLRVLTAGPIITVQNGYPLPIFGKGYVAEAARSPDDAKALVRKLVAGGAAVIKIALEPGGEPGAPWSHHASAPPPWPMAPLETVTAIVAEAHRLGKRVTAHIGENSGAAITLAAGVDEWAHVPCSELDDALVEKAAQQKVRVVTTLDTLSHCAGVSANARKLAKAGVSFLYGAEIAHTDIPWGVDAREMELMRHLAAMSDVDILRAATSESGKELGLEPLGRLAAGAPADLIAVKGDPVGNFKLLEYPDLVISGGTIVVNNFTARE